MTFPKFYTNVIRTKDGPALRIYKKASIEEGLKPICEDAPLEPENVKKLMRELVEWI